MSKPLTCKEVGEKTGKILLEKYGKPFFSQMGKKSAAKRLGNMTDEEKREYFKRLNQLSYESRMKKKHGKVAKKNSLE